jgi:hypothetical protein
MWLSAFMTFAAQRRLLSRLGLTGNAIARERSDEDSMGVDSGLLWIQTEVANPFTLEATNVR